MNIKVMTMKLLKKIGLYKPKLSNIDDEYDRYINRKYYGYTDKGWNRSIWKRRWRAD